MAVRSCRRKAKRAYIAPFRRGILRSAVCRCLLVDALAGTQIRTIAAPRYRIPIELFGVAVIALTAHLGGFLSGVNS
jgi:hypothetical protein